MGLCMTNTSPAHWGSPWRWLCCDPVCQAKMALLPSNEKSALVIQLTLLFHRQKAKCDIESGLCYVQSILEKRNNMNVCFSSLQDFFCFVFSKTKQKPQEIQMERKLPFYASVLRTWWIFFFLRQIPLLTILASSVGILLHFHFNATFAD